MKIISLTGVTRSEEIPVTKSIGSLIVACASTMTEFSTEKISVYIERANGSNIIIANKVPLVDFMLASTYGTEAIQSDVVRGYFTVALCELAVGGSIFLAEKETIRILLEDLNQNVEYDLFGVEEPASSNVLYLFEQKTMAREEFNKKIDIAGYDLAVMTTRNTIQDISYHFENNTVIKYLPFELQTLSRDVDPIQSIYQGEVSQGLASRLVLPLAHVNYLEINKSQDDIVNLVVRTTRQI